MTGMKTIALALSLFLLAGCGALGGPVDQKNPVQLLSLLAELNRAAVSTSADLKAMRDAAPAAFDASDKNHDGYLQPRELPRFLRDGKLPARAAFVQVLRNDSALLRARGDAKSIAIADRVDAVLLDIDGWLLVIDLFGQ
jgi:outer membrane murein-binding lipoprotein Lpp